MPVPSAFLLALALAVSATAAAEPQSLPSETGLRRIELRDVAPDEAPEVRISPGISTLLTFDAKPTREPSGALHVELERSATFERVELGSSVLRLVPSDALKEGDRLRLSIRFGDGAAPPEVTFLLVVRRNLPDRLVEVYREPRTLESYQQEVREAWAAVRRCEETRATAQASPGGLAGMTALRAAGALADNGVVIRKLSKAAARLRGGAFVAKQLLTYRADSRVLVELSLRSSQAGAPWTAREASLTGRGGESLKVVSVWQESPATEARPGWVLVEAEAGASLSLDEWTLTLSEEGGGRPLVLEGIAFAPVAQGVQSR